VNGDYCAPGYVCQTGGNTCHECGGAGQPCCPGNHCTTGTCGGFPPVCP
jgi:hypothetical protein